MKAPRPLTSREAQVARLAASRTRDDAIALLIDQARIYRESGCGNTAAAIDHAIGLLRDRLSIHNVVSEL